MDDETVKKLLNALNEDVEAGILRDRMSCIMFCYGYMHRDGYMPLVAIERINKLYYDGVIEA